MSDLWSDSVLLMSLGMGTVFVFLSLLVVGTTLMSSAINRFAPQEPQVPTSAKVSDDTPVAVVAAAAFAASKKSV
jgi:oxaloacetate decarboxylase gamma subunit